MEQLLGRNYSFNLFNFIDRFQTRIVQAIFMVEKKNAKYNSDNHHPAAVS